MEYSLINGSFKTITCVQQSATIEGTFIVRGIAHLYGKVLGRIQATPGGVIVLGPSSEVYGDVVADVIFMHGFVQGNLYADVKAQLSEYARLQGNIYSKLLQLDYGARWHGSCTIHPTQKIEMSS